MEPIRCKNCNSPYSVKCKRKREWGDSSNMSIMSVCVVDILLLLLLVPVDGKRRASLSSQRIPLLLECGHSYCSQCLQKMSHLQSSDLPCPQCRVRRGREGGEGGRGRDESLLCIHVQVHVLYWPQMLNPLIVCIYMLPQPLHVSTLDHYATKKWFNIVYLPPSPLPSPSLSLPSCLLPPPSLPPSLPPLPLPLQYQTPFTRGTNIVTQLPLSYYLFGQVVASLLGIKW